MSHFARSSLIIAVFFGVDKVVGFIRALIVNRQFGLSFELDVFNAANNIPDLLSALISGGALGVALIPVISEYLEKKGRPAAWDLFSRIINLGFIITGAIALVIILIAPWLVDVVIAPGFPTEQKALTTELMRLDLIAIMIFSISGLVMGGLQANQHFLLPAMAPTLYNVGQIFGAVVLARAEPTTIGPITLPGFGMGIQGLVFGVIIGAALHLLIQVPGLIRYQFRWTPRINLKDEGVRRVLALLGPRVATMFFIQMFFIVRDNLASGMGEGAVTALNQGWFIMQVPETLLGTATAIAILPTISEIFSRRETEKFRDTVKGAVRALMALTIPAAVLLGVGLTPLVKVAFSYTAAETALVVLAARIYLCGLVGHALLEIAARSFYAQQDAKTPLLAAALNAFIYLGLALWFSNLMGFKGIAIANSTAFTLEAALLLYLLNRRFPGLMAVGKTFLRVILVSATVGVGAFFLLQLGFIVNLSEYMNAAATAGVLVLGLVVVVPFILPELKLWLRLGEQKTSV